MGGTGTGLPAVQFHSVGPPQTTLHTPPIWSSLKEAISHFLSLTSCYTDQSDCVSVCPHTHNNMHTHTWTLSFDVCVCAPGQIMMVRIDPFIVCSDQSLCPDLRCYLFIFRQNPPPSPPVAPPPSLWNMSILQEAYQLDLFRLVSAPLRKVLVLTGSPFVSVWLWVWVLDRSHDFVVTSCRKTHFLQGLLGDRKWRHLDGNQRSGGSWGGLDNLDQFLVRLYWHPQSRTLESRTRKLWSLGWNWESLMWIHHVSA